MKDTEKTTNTSEEPVKAEKSIRSFPYKYLALAAGGVVLLMILWWLRVIVIWILSTLAGLAAIGFLAYAAYAAFSLYVRKQPKDQWQKPFNKALLGTAACVVCYLIVGWVGNLIVPSGYDEEGLAKIRTALYLMGLEDAVVTSAPDSAVVVAYGLETDDPAVEALAKSGSIMGAAAEIINKGSIYTIGIRDNKPVVGVKADLVFILRAINDSNTAMQLHSHLKVLDESMLNDLWR